MLFRSACSFFESVISVAEVGVIICKVQGTEKQGLGTEGQIRQGLRTEGLGTVRQGHQGWIIILPTPS